MNCDSKSCALACAIATASWVLPAFAQDADEAVEEVVVTGSRIPQPNQASPSPIQVVSSTEIQATGHADISDVINQLPQVFNNDLGQDLGNRTSGLTTAGGVATADLRGLGPNRTLVLVNGRRLGQGSPYTFIQSPAPDLDQIPTFLIDRIDVVTGGASAVYGSDAIAGVVNFILKKDFQGMQVDAQIGENWHDNHNDFAQSAVKTFGEKPLTGTSHDGRTQSFSILLGTNFSEGQGNVTGYFNYFHVDPVASGDRDFGQCQMAAASTRASGMLNTAVCSGSSNSNFFAPQTGPNAGTVYSVHGNEFVPQGSVPTAPPAAFNSQPYIFMSRGDDRYNAGFMAHYDLKDWVQPYAEFGFMNDRSHQEVAPAALFRGSNPLDPLTGNYYVNCGNPLLSAQQQSALGCTSAQINGDQSLAANQVNVEIGRRNVEGGGRFSDYEHTNYRGVVGARGDISEGWTYDAYGQYYYTQFFNSNERYLNFASIGNALLVTTDDAGNPVCISGPPCVPYNIWEDNGVTPAALNYLYTNGTGNGSTTLRTLHGDITGELGRYGIKSPVANDGVAINFGFEHRNENVTFAPDAAELSGLLSGFGSAAVAIDNDVSVDEQFIELRAPLAQDKPGMSDLVFGAGLRRSDFSTSGAVNTYKFDVQYAPIEDLRFRGSYQRAIRGPSIIELFNPQLVGLIQAGNDPCAPPATAPLEQCLHTVSAADAAAFTDRYNGVGGLTIPQATLGQLSQLSGGNTELQPEKSKSYSVGFVFSPSALPNLSGSIDWWDVKLEGAVGVIPVNVILDNCLKTGNPVYCSQIVRADNTFSLTGNNIPAGGYLIQTNTNIGAAEASGVDVQTSYRLSMPASAGALLFSLNGSYLLKGATTPLPGAHTYDCAGLFGSTCQTVNPRWRHNLRTTWQTPWDLDISLNWRFIGKVALDQNDQDPSLRFAAFGVYNSFAAQLPNMSYLDLSATWHAWNKLEIRGGINNMLDKDPPLATFEITSGGAANTYSTYDAFGRQLFLALTAKF